MKTLPKIGDYLEVWATPSNHRGVPDLTSDPNGPYNNPFASDAKIPWERFKFPIIKVNDDGPHIMVTISLNDTIWANEHWARNYNGHKCYSISYYKTIVPFVPAEQNKCKYCNASIVMQVL